MRRFRRRHGLQVRRRPGRPPARRESGWPVRGVGGEPGRVRSGLPDSAQDSSAADVLEPPAELDDELGPEEPGPMFVHLWPAGAVAGFLAVELALALELSAGEAGALAVALAALDVTADLTRLWVAV